MAAQPPIQQTLNPVPVLALKCKTRSNMMTSFHKKLKIKYIDKKTHGQKFMTNCMMMGEKSQNRNITANLKNARTN